MRFVLTGFTLFAICAWSQTVSLKSALTALGNSNTDRTSATRRLVGAMMPLAQADNRPSPETVENFAIELARVMTGRKLTTGQLSAIETAIAEVMRGSVPNLVSTGHLRDALTAVHIDSSDTRAIISRFLVIGEEVRGPDDFRLSKAR